MRPGAGGQGPKGVLVASHRSRQGEGSWGEEPTGCCSSWGRRAGMGQGPWPRGGGQAWLGGRTQRIDEHQKGQRRQKPAVAWGMLPGARSKGDQPPAPMAESKVWERKRRKALLSTVVQEAKAHGGAADEQVRTEADAPVDKRGEKHAECIS